MSSELLVGLFGFMAVGPPAYYAIYRSIRADRADEAARLEERIQAARQEGLDEALRQLEVQGLKDQITELEKGREHGPR